MSRGRLLERFHGAVDHGDAGRARSLLLQLERVADDAETAFARWRLGALDEDLGPAERAVRAAIERFPDEPDLQHALGWTLLELDRPAEAVPFFEEACYLDPDFADAWHDLALAREATGDTAGMRQAFAEVFEIDTAGETRPLRFAPEQVGRWAERAVAALPDDVRRLLPEIPVFVQDYPDAWILEEPPWDPRLLGLFDGPTWAEREGSGPPAGGPHVYLYQRNLERICADSRDMAEQIRITLHHEIGHYLGLDEDDLDLRGLA